MTDHSWEALVEVTNVNPTQARGELNYALGQIRRATEYMDLGDEELAGLIRYRAKLYRELMPEVLLTPPSLAKWWDRVEPESKRVNEYAEEKVKTQRKAVNVHAHSDCVTCGGDHYVVVGYREPKPSIWGEEHGIKHKQSPHDKGHEETAPCPVCNTNAPVLKNFWDGRSWTYGDGPGELSI